MANDIFISDLPAQSGDTTLLTDVVAQDDGTTTKKLSISQIAKSIIENFTGSSLAGSSQSVKSAIDSLNSKMPYVLGIGGPYTRNVAPAFGTVTGGGTTAYVFIPMSMSSNVTTVSLVDVKMSMRIPTGGYLGSASLDILHDSSLTVTAEVAKYEQCIKLSIVKSGGWGVANNIPIAGYMEIFKFSLS